MKIIIPMAGYGKRYNEEHFFSPKPLIEIDGRKIIEHVINMFPRDSEFIFLCNNQHLKKSPLKQVLTRAAPNSMIISITDEYMNGPVSSCVPALNLIDDDEEIVVNYCDFVQTWNFNDFMSSIHKKNAKGAMATFIGFHPSSLGDTYYCYLKVNKDNWITDISEKKSFSKDRTKDYASTGTYYFAKGKIFKKYVQETLKTKGLKVSEEYYMSFPYILMIRDNLRILNFPVSKFICLGTPRDYHMYKFWSEFFLKYSNNFITFDNVNVKTINILPVAGEERDFKELGINSLNFLVPIMNKPLLYYSLNSCPKGIKNIFISLKKNEKEFNISVIPKQFHYNSEVIFLNDKSAGNAATILKVKQKIPKDYSVCVSGCTYILDYDERRMSHLMENDDIDVILFSFSHHECILRDPLKMHYAKVDNLSSVIEIVGKNQIISKNPYKDQALTGTAIYKKAEDLFSSIEEFMEQKKEIHPFFLSAVNSLIKKGKKVVVFEVDKFVPIRTVKNYLEFKYWQDFFNDLSYYPYSKIIQ